MCAVLFAIIQRELLGLLGLKAPIKKISRCPLKLDPEA